MIGGNSEVASIQNFDRKLRMKLSDGSTVTNFYDEVGAGVAYSGTSYYYFNIAGIIYLTGQGTSSKTYTLQFEQLTPGNTAVRTLKLAIFEIGA
jgi:hypothetical protein